MDIPKIPRSGSERDTLVAFLDYNRAVVLNKCAGLTKEQLGQRLEPSSLTLSGIIYHLALVELDWFVGDVTDGGLGEPWESVDWKASPDWEFDTAPTLDPDEVFDTYRRACARSNEIVAATDSLDQLSIKGDRDGNKWSLRWILVHMIEETARHAGHADLIRESIDGEVGDFRGE